jgi:glucose-1-phosphate cytidylyltransferase
MKTVILAGGRGTRISEESHLRPKPMIEIGGQPILLHIMKIYSYYGHNEFIICAGYMQHLIKEHFANYYLHHSDITFDFRKGNEVIVHNNFAEPWKITVIDTGLDTLTGGRIKRIKDYIGDETFMMTYGDGLCDLDVNKLIEFHHDQSTLATLTAVQPSGRFGTLDIEGSSRIKRFAEKHKKQGGWVNGGFMVLEPGVFDYIEGDATTFEREPLESLSNKGELSAFLHDGFWQCMDTMKDRQDLEMMILSGHAPWMRYMDMV